jgi:hypothetical protein
LIQSPVKFFVSLGLHELLVSGGYRPTAFGPDCVKTKTRHKHAMESSF